MSTILVVDDEPQLRCLYAGFLQRLGFRVCSARNGREAEALMEQERPQVVVLDDDLPDMDGIEALHRLRRASYAGRVVLLVGPCDEAKARRIRQLGAVDVERKPCGLDRLERAVAEALATACAARAGAPGSERGDDERRSMNGRVTFERGVARAKSLMQGRVS